jgi:H+/Cl- antiporter ClcA
MGGEFLIALGLIGGIAGFLAVAVVLLRSKAKGWKRLIFPLIVFVLGLVTPTVIFFGFGTYVKITQPQIEIPARD